MNGRGYNGMGLDGEFAGEVAFSDTRRNSGHRKGLNSVPHSRRCLQRILVPVDFSVSSLEGVRYALEIANKQPAEVLLLHVIALKFNWPPSGPVNVSQLRQEIWAEAESKMQALVEIMRVSGVSAQPVVQEGAPWKIIAAHAKQWGVTLIVIGGHAKKLHWSPFHRHTARRVVESAPCPVLTLPQPQISRACRGELA
jgi:nucleotide-binding universal stress UspA family protein